DALPISEHVLPRLAVRLAAMPRTAARLARLLAATALCLCATLAAAQVCSEELAAAVPGGELDRPATGVDAALVLRRAVQLVEPALPPLVGGGGAVGPAA